MRGPWAVAVGLAGLLLAVLPLTAGAHPGAADTLVTMAFDGAIEFQPGLCLPGDTPSCVGPHESQFKATTARCRAAGTLEGAALPVDAACRLEFAGFLRPNVEGVAKPNCVSAETFSSDRAAAFGPGANKGVTVSGSTRAASISYPARLGGLITMTGWLDDADPDADPAGDHRLVLHIDARPMEGDCVTAPLTRVEMSNGVAFVQ